MKQKSTFTAFLLWALTGGIAGHKIYLKEDTGKILLFIITGGGLGFWWLLNLFTLGKKVKEYNRSYSSGSNQNTNNNTNTVVVNVSK